MQWSVFIPVVLVATLAIGVEVVFAMRDHPAARRSGLVAAFGIAAFPVAIVVHNALSAFIGGEEAVSFILGILVAPAAITAGTLGVAVALRDDPASRGLFAGLASAGAGLALFAGYMVFALVVTSLSGTNPPYQAAVESVVLPVSGLAIVGGALYAGIALVSGRRLGAHRFGG
jgi:hypothetical protein